MTSKMRIKVQVLIPMLFVMSCCIHDIVIDENTIIQECPVDSISDWKGWSVSWRSGACYYVIQKYEGDTVSEHLILIPDKQRRIRLTDDNKSADHYTLLKDLHSDPLWSKNYVLMKESTLREIISFTLDYGVEHLRVYDDRAYLKGRGYDLCYSFHKGIASDFYETINDHWSRRQPMRNIKSPH